jgi:hypothetical protein
LFLFDRLLMPQQQLSSRTGINGYYSHEPYGPREHIFTP